MEAMVMVEGYMRVSRKVLHVSTSTVFKRGQSADSGGWISAQYGERTI